MDAPSWKRYVAKLCTEACNLEAAATQQVLTRIDALISAHVLTEPAVALVLWRAGVALEEADQVAPSIWMAIRA